MKQVEKDESALLRFQNSTAIDVTAPTQPASKQVSVLDTGYRYNDSVMRVDTIFLLSSIKTWGLLNQGVHCEV